MIKVSVFLATYNHAPYIAQAIESAVNQETDFDYEILIGEDFSTDATRDIVKKYAEKYPNKIRTFLYDRNMGGHTNVDTLIQASRGHYLAWLEGDDYWTDTKKLQKQANVLDNHADVMISFHNVSLVNQEGVYQGDFFTDNAPPELTDINRLIMGNYIHTPSCMFRHHVAEIIQPWIHFLTLGDWPRHLLLAEHGKIHYLPDIMAAYRNTQSGVWSQRPLADKYKKMLEVLHAFNCHTKKKHDQVVFDSLTLWHERLMALEEVNAETLMQRIRFVKNVATEKYKINPVLCWEYLKKNAFDFIKNGRTVL